MSNYVTLAEAADYLCVSRNTLRNWDSNGKLIANRNPVNGYRRYDMRALASMKSALDDEVPAIQTSEATKEGGIEPTAHAIRSLINRLHNIIRDSDASSDIMQRFDEVSKLLFVKLLADKRSDTALFTNENMHECAESLRARYRLLLEEYEVDSFGQEEAILLNDNCLYQCAKQLASVDLSKCGTDVKGLAYEEVIRGTFDKSDNQQFFTPPLVVDFMVAMFSERLEGIVCDPACGTSSFLIAASKQEPEQAEFIGFEIDPRLAWVSELNLCLHGIDNGCIQLFGEGGSLGDEATSFFSNVDVILTNPPFGSDYTNPSILSNFELGRNKKSRRRGILFIEQAWNLLKVGGVVAIIIDQGVLTSTSTKDVRSYILSHYDVLAIVDLPDTAFMPYASVSTSILFLEKKDASVEKQTSQTFFARAHNVGRRPNGDDDYCYEDDGTAKINNDLVDILAAWRRFIVGDPMETTVDVYACSLPEEAFDNPDLRLDYAFHHPVRLRSINDMKSCLYPLIELSELCSERNETYIPSADPDASTIMLTGLANIESNNGKATQVRVAAASVKSGVKRYEKNDILFAKMRPSLRKIALMSFEEGGYASNECAVFTVRLGKDGTYLIDPSLLATILRSDFVYGQIVHLIQGSGRPRINAKNLRHIKIPIIPKDVQDKMVERVGAQAQLVAQMRRDASTLLREAETLEKSATNGCVNSLLRRNDA